MARAYLEIIEARNELIKDQVFNVGFENHKVKELAILVDDIFLIN